MYEKLFNNYEKTMKKLSKNYEKTIEKLSENYSISMKKLFNKYEKNITNHIQEMKSKRNQFSSNPFVKT